MNDDKLTEAYKEIAELEKHNKELSTVLSMSLKQSELRKNQCIIMLKMINSCINHQIFSNAAKLLLINRILLMVNMYIKHDKE